MRTFLSLAVAALSLLTSGCAVSHDYYDRNGYRYEHSHGYDRYQEERDARRYEHERQERERARAHYYREREREAAHRYHHSEPMRYTRDHGRDRDDDNRHDHRR